MASGIVQTVLAVDRVVMVIPQLGLANRKSPLQDWNGFAVLSLKAHVWFFRGSILPNDN